MASSEPRDQDLSGARKRVRYDINRIESASPVANVLEMFKANSRAFFDTSNQWIIDVFPNMVPIIMYIMLMATRHFNAVTDRDFAKVSQHTICMYYVSIVYGFFLLNDLDVRPQTSSHASSWKEISWKKDFVELLSVLPVPEFLKSILSQFYPAETERTKNIFFIPSAAGFDHDQFFGRVFPVNFFAEMHDCLANLQSNSTRIDIIKALFSEPLYTIGEEFTCTIPDLIGVSINQTTNTTANHMNSKLYQVYNSLFNPVLFRDNQRRSSLAALSFQPPAYANSHIGAYDLLFAATPNNLRELQVVLQAVGPVLSSASLCSDKLGTFVKNYSGNNIMSHGYSSYALPTWCYTAGAGKSDTFRAVTLLRQVTAEARAADFSFLQPPAAALTTTHAVVDVHYATAAAPGTSIDVPENHVITRHNPYSLRLDQNHRHPYPRHDTEDFVKFSDSEHTHPTVLVLDTAGNEGLTAYLTGLSGKIIESFELDGSTVSHPNALRSVGGQNAQFADSAIPYKYVRPGTDWHPRTNAQALLPPLHRPTLYPSSRPVASSLLLMRNAMMLPQFQRNIHVAPPAALPGVTPIPGVVLPRAAQSMIGFACCDGSSNLAANDAVPGMTENELLIWSPYTYTPYESHEWPAPDHSQSRHYYLTNLRTIFGTDYNLVSMRHPYASLTVT